jgi:hypothetical protein
VAGADGSRLSFRTTLVDQFQDVFGYLTLALPRSAVTPGAPLALTVTGQDAESSDWYMTFRHRLAAHPRVAQDPVLVKAGDAVEAQIRVILDNLSGARAVRVEVAGHAPVDTSLQAGANVVRALAGPVVAAPDVHRAGRDSSAAPFARSGPAASGAARAVRVVVVANIGLPNAMTQMVNSWKDQIPLLVAVASVDQDALGRDQFQETDHHELMTEPITT